MIEINPNAFYSHEDLRKMFGELGIQWAWFRSVLKPKKITGKAYWGGDLIKAIQTAQETKERDDARNLVQVSQRAKPTPRKRDDLLSRTKAKLGL